jgi:hypothetical protein
MTISRIVRKRLEGKLEGKLSSFEWRNCLIEAIPMSVSMLVYIDVASAVNSSA